MTDATLYPHHPIENTRPNDVFPQRPGYVRPDRADDLKPTRITADAVRTNGTTFEQAQAAITHAQNEFHRHIGRINEHKQHYTDAGYRAQINAFQDTDAYKALDHHLDAVNARRDQAQANIDRIRAALSPNGDTAAELRATRYWNRTKAILDTQPNGPGIMAKGRKFISTATPAELGTLLQELKAYCAARGVSAEWINPAIGEVAPEYRRAVKQLTKAQQAVIVTEHNAHRLKNNIAKGLQVPIQLSRPNRAGDYDPDK